MTFYAKKKSNSKQIKANGCLSAEMLMQAIESNIFGCFESTADLYTFSVARIKCVVRKYLFESHVIYGR